MFKKLKDKLAEEVKSSPQRIQQFAQAAQAAVTSASSSISDITNNDLFSITDNDNTQNNSIRSQPSPSKQQTPFQDVSLTQSPSEIVNYSNDMETPRQRRLSNSSFASDVSFRLPSYETPSTYHLQSDMEVSASEADDRGFSGGPATLDRVTKEQLYSAYKRTQERYTKYRNQYGDLARHYKLLERENAKARSVLVETQDKALRRISELKEQCSLEQSAKAHLEKALRIDIEEKNLKIEALNTKINLLQNIEDSNSSERKDSTDDVQLINLAADNNPQTPTSPNDEPLVPDITSLNNKIEKMEQLLNKYKESLKMSKDKNSQITAELQLLSNEVDTKNKVIQELNTIKDQLSEANIKIKELNEANEELQNRVNASDFTKIKELSTLEIDLQKANEEVSELRSKVEVFSKKEEEYAISLAENKLSIHKELESKEAEIKSLKDSLSASKQEVQSLKIVIDDYKSSLSTLEEEKLKLNKDNLELTSSKARIDEMNSQLQELSKKCQSLEQMKTKADEEYKCLQLQLKQETAEKLAMIDRNTYLESRNSQLHEDNTKKSTYIHSLENSLQILAKEKNDTTAKDEAEVGNLLKEMNMWKTRCETLESEIQEEREELVKLQSEIEKLLANHELIQSQNAEYRTTIHKLTEENCKIQDNAREYKKQVLNTLKKMSEEASDLRRFIQLTSSDTKTMIQTNKESLSSLINTNNINELIRSSVENYSKELNEALSQCSKLKKDNEKLQEELVTFSRNNSTILSEKMALELKISELNEESNTEEYTLKDKLLDKTNAYEQTLQNLNSATTENKALHKTIKEIESEKELLRNSLQSLVSDKKELNVTILDLENKLSKLNEDFETTTKQLKESTKVVSSLQIENEQLNKLKNIELDASQQLQTQLNIERENNAKDVELLRQKSIEIKDLNDRLIDIENQNVQLVAQLDDVNKLHKTLSEKVKKMEEMANELKLAKSNEMQQVEEQNSKLNSEIMEIKKDYDKIKVENDNLKREYQTTSENITKLNSVITNKSEDCERKLIQINELENKCTLLSEENIKLKSEVTNFSSNIKILESEIDDIKKSHTEIESEKDRLNKIIENLENKEVDQSNMAQTKDTQTETDGASVEIVKNISDTASMFENKWVLENKQSAMSHTSSLNLKTNIQEDIVEQFSALKINYDTLKDDNRRLQSDIEGLQSYLTKISKENSVLNDKLREVIATSEHSMDDQLSNDVTKFRYELESGKEKINDLLRENSLLVEENLELKDQLNSQNYSKPQEIDNNVNNNHHENIKQKYEDLLQNNNEVKKQNKDLEQINKSVSGNVMQLQEKNEKLKLSNEKLERRLDEALVSLRHLHSLSENTELEYLRNILYEYLTGTGAHSVTLAKVLAAIVKFDDMQTQMVLQKEKERQGFLRQLGII